MSIYLSFDGCAAMEKWKAQLRQCGGLFLVAIAIIVTGWIWYEVVPTVPGLEKASEDSRSKLAYLLCGWAIIPPTWFFLEWVIFAPKIRTAQTI
ncbi:hypothetical protein [Methylobacterium sp. AMS5]|uniref:hypothetical protein n=1 Tax=Methylobacterium sp. AMS5 TaxID=925818 RepID=UPI00118767B2|nr:hypothetical protein [Methylobacterium sp. AMS5]